MSPSGVIPLQEQTVTRSLAARTRVLTASAALLLAVGALAGCSDHPGQVADMHYTGLDGASHSVVVSEKDIDVVVKEMASVPGQTGQERLGANRSEIAGSLITEPILAEVGKAHGLTVTDAQIVKLAKEQLGFEPRRASTLTYLRGVAISSQLESLRQQPQQAQKAQPVFADLKKVYDTLDGDLSPRYSTKGQTWLTQTDPNLASANNPLGGGQQQAPQQPQQAPQQGGQQQPQQQAPQQGGDQQPQQQAPQQGGDQQPQQQGGQQPADSGQTDGQTGTGQGGGDAGESGQGADQSETNGQ